MWSLDEFKMRTAELPDPVDVREEWLDELGWHRPHGAWCGCPGCDPFAYSDDLYLVIVGEEMVFGFVEIAMAVRLGEAAWDDSAHMAVAA